MFKLIIEDDEGKTTVVPITRDEITIGRKEGNNIRLTERNVSRNHARIVRANGHVSIEDLDSYNGIRVNGDRIPVKNPQSIQEGDLIEIGDYHLAIQLEGSDAPGLAGAGTGDESTQRVSLPQNQPHDEVTSQVAMHQDMTSPGHIHQDTPPLMGEASARAPVQQEVTAQVAMSAQPAAAPSANGTAPNHFEATLEQDAPPPRRAEPTAIIRHSDIAAAAPQNAAQDSARLVVVSTNFAGRIFALTKDEMIIGRTDDNDIQIDHRSVSRNHAKIVREGTRYSVVDLKSANGVLVNGEEYAKMDLRKGDIIELGHVKMRFVEPGEAFSLSAAELEKMKLDEPPDDEGNPAEPGLVTSRIAARAPGSGSKLPVKQIGIAVAVLLLLSVGIGVAMSSGKNAPAKDPQKDPATQVAAKDPEPKPTQEEPPPPTKVRTQPKKDPERQPEKVPEPPPPVAEKPDPARMLKSAKDAIKAGDFTRAQELYQGVVDAGDGDGQGKEGLQQVQKEVAARQQLEDALERKESDPRGCYHALAAVPTGTRARARADAEMRAIKPRVVDNMLKEARKQLDSDPQTARDIAMEALEVDRNSREAANLVKEAEKALKAKRSQPSKPPPQETAKKDPTPAPAPANNKAADARKALEEGNRAILLGNFEEAVAKGKQALKLDPSLSEAHKLLGVAYARQTKYCDAKFHYKKFIDLNPSSPMVDRIKQILQGPELQNCP